jgi:hypothetical protein
MVPSPRLALVLAALHAAAAACVLAVLPGASGFLLAAALLALGLTAAWSRALLRSRASVRALELGATLTVELTSGERFVAEADERRYVSRLVVALPIRRPARRTVLVTADMMSAADFRQLRLWALWGRLPGVAAAQLPA